MMDDPYTRQYYRLIVHYTPGPLTEKLMIEDNDFHWHKRVNAFD